MMATGRLKRQTRTRFKERDAMLSETTYRILHIFGILLVFGALGGMNMHALNGGTRESNAARRLVGATLGAGLLIILIAGFGLVAKLGLARGGLPAWVWLKMGIWLALGGLATLPYRRPKLARLTWIGFPLLGALAATLALTRPM